MSEQGPGPTEAELMPPAEATEQKDITQRPEYAQACQNTEHKGDLIRELLKLGVPETEVKTFAFARLEKRIRDGHGLNTIRSIAKQGGAISESEVDALFAEVTAKIRREMPTETEEEKAARESKELEDMLSLYEVTN